jgi:maltose O-acetyltransferase
MIGRIKKRLFWELRKREKNRWGKRAVRQASQAGGSLNYSQPPSLDCPIRCDGAGDVRLDGKVSFGYKKAPKLADGEILIQARSPESRVSIGSGTTTSNNISIVACSKISIGENCQIGDLVAIYDCDFHEINPETRNNSAGEIIPVKIGNNVWLGSRVMVLKGVNIGDNSVIAAGSIVTKSIPPRCLAAGIPAKIIRYI